MLLGTKKKYRRWKENKKKYRKWKENKKIKGN